MVKLIIKRLLQLYFDYEKKLKYNVNNIILMTSITRNKSTNSMYSTAYHTLCPLCNKLYKWRTSYQFSSNNRELYHNYCTLRPVIEGDIDLWNFFSRQQNTKCIQAVFKNSNGIGGSFYLQPGIRNLHLFLQIVFRPTFTSSVDGKGTPIEKIKAYNMTFYAC